MIRLLVFSLVAIAFLVDSSLAADARPNIFLAIADDWGFPHAGAYGDPVVKTETFDRIAKEGVLFTNAFVSSPSCTPSRGALLTGRYHWSLEEGANLWSTLPTKYRSYPEILKDAGYVTGHSRKAWGPGKLEVGGRKEDPSGPVFKDFPTFLESRPKDKPFCYWWGSGDPHRPYEWQSGAKSGMDLKKIKLPGAFPDHDTVRNDVADYYWEVQRFNRELGDALAALEKTGELENTIIVITGDHGMPFPRGKSNLYDLGTHVPLAIRWGAKVKGGRTFDGFVSLVDLAPTFLEAAGFPRQKDMMGVSLFSELTQTRDPKSNILWDHVIFGKERHVPSQEKGNLGGYPSRAIRNKDFLYIRNFEPDRWPVGIPDAANSEIGNSFADTDDGPTKTFILHHRDEPVVKKSFDLAFGKRPKHELYDLQKDPEQLVNVANEASYRKTRRELSDLLIREMQQNDDPRANDDADVKFDKYPYYGGKMKAGKE
jgi:N-sulfoglucosamine sulfohydrolase